MMAAELAPVDNGETLPGRLREDGYDLPAGLSFERWAEIGSTLQQMEKSVQWWLGDWWNYGERNYGELAAQATKDMVKDATGYAYSTVNKAAWVARRFEDIRRRTNLPWSHHAEVAALPPVEQDALLDAAVEQGLTRYDLRSAARERKQALEGRAVAVTGEVLESPDLPVLTVDDLTDEARAPLNVRLAEMSARMRPGFAAGWVQALVWAGQDDAFRRRAAHD